MWPRRARAGRSTLGRLGRRSSRGQTLVEFAIIVPLMVAMLFGCLETGLMFTHHMSLEYATREGARAGAALANGKQDPTTCNTTNGGIDAQIVAAVERVIDSPGSPIVMPSVTSIKIFLATSPTDPTPISAAATETWTYASGAGPVVDGKAIDFVISTGFSGSPPWTPCNRDNNYAGLNPRYPSCSPSIQSCADSMGVAVNYTYGMVTPLAAIVALASHGSNSGQTTIPMSDVTIMTLQP